jgi:cell division protein ZapE|tara:strand:+ start:4841 stop:5878 length:1038 start_codon:yes stop_codon:yes gene_type:complete
MQLFFNSKIFTLDKNQIPVFQELEKLSKSSNRKESICSRIFSPKKPQSLYIYGQVGRGKSMLMSYFFNLIKKDKKYFHFNDFVQTIHRELHNIRSDSSRKNNVLEITINNILGGAKVLCLDEFQIHDIVDAMILSDVFKYIFKKHILVIFTSNSHPLSLYKDGIQRQYFLEFVKDTLLNECQILSLDGKRDYRSSNVNLDNNFLYPINNFNKKLFNQVLEGSLSGAKMEIWTKCVLGRKITIKDSHHNIALIDFENFFGDNLGVVDFIEICKYFNIIFIKNIPELGNHYNNETKRFISFIDEAYENNIKLVILSQNSIDKIYHDGLLSDLFQRTASRLRQLTNKK